MIDTFEKKTLNSLAARNINLSKETTTNLKKSSSVFGDDEKNEDPSDEIVGKEKCL